MAERIQIPPSSPTEDDAISPADFPASNGAQTITNLNKIPAESPQSTHPNDEVNSLSTLFVFTSGLTAKCKLFDIGRIRHSVK